MTKDQYIDRVETHQNNPELDVAEWTGGFSDETKSKQTLNRVIKELFEPSDAVNSTPELNMRDAIHWFYLWLSTVMKLGWTNERILNELKMTEYLNDGDKSNYYDYIKRMFKESNL